MIDLLNVLVTSFRFHEGKALRILGEFGEFKGTEFRDIILGKVEDKEKFLEAIKPKMEADASKSISRIIPFDSFFVFEAEKLLDKLKEVIAVYTGFVAENELFDIRMKRRGLKGVINSQEVENALREHFSELLKTKGIKAKLDFEKPDKIIVIETVGQQCGVGLISKDLTAKYSFVRVG